MQGNNGNNGNVNLVYPGHTVFEIGNEEVSVPPISFWLSEVLDGEMTSIGPGMAHGAYVNTVLKIVATCIEADKAGPDNDPPQEKINETFTRLKRRLTVPEGLKLYSTLTELYRNSGFPIPEPQETAAPASENGASMESAQTSLFEESAGPIH